VPQPVGGSASVLGPPIAHDGSDVIVPFPLTLRRPPGGQPQSLTITTDGPIDTPIVILGQ
jgi:hypothetical protein